MIKHLEKEGNKKDIIKKTLNTKYYNNYNLINFI